MRRGVGGRAGRCGVGDHAGSAKTVRNHLSNIFAKLRVSDRTQAVLRARDAGLIQ